MGEVTALDNATFAEPTRPADATNPALNDTVAASTTPVIEPSVTTTDFPAPVEMGSYTVKKGDSLWSIARKNGVSISALLDANGLSRNSVLKPGQTLKIPATTTAPVSSTSSDSYTSSSGEVVPVAAGSVYVVKSGDTLGKIAKAHGVSVRALKSANKIYSSTNTIRIGQKLKIPSKHAKTATASTDTAPVVSSSSTETSTSSGEVSAPVSEDGYITHKVASGESPAIIAHKYGMKTSELVSLNNISDPRRLKIGQELKVKASAGVSATTEATTATVTDGSAMSVEALEAATATTTDATAPVVEVKPESTLK